MSDFNSQLERMKSLMTYGQVNESNNTHNNYSLEYKFKAADGKTYGIIKECNHYYIKQAETGKEAIAESYSYLGGFNNKKDYEYNSYANALKNFELKMSSINEAQEAKVDYTTLDPYKKEDLVLEGTENMKNEIARQRQIMYNACMIMNESTDYAVKGGKACTTNQPEAENGKKGDEEYKEVDAKPEFAGTHVGLDKKAEPFKEAPKAGKDQLKENEDEWASKGLPSTPGVGEADNDKNNAPFDEIVNEECEDGVCGMPEEGCCHEEEDGDVVDVDVEEPEDEELDLDDEGDVEDDELDLDDEESVEGLEDEPEGEDIEDEDDFDFDEEDTEFDEEDPDSLRAEIDRLQVKLNALEGNEEDFEDDDDFEEDGEDDFGEEEEPEFGEEGEEDFDTEEEPEFGEDGEDLEGIEDEDSEFEGETDECGMMPMMEAKRAKMNSIVESVVKRIMNEDELHDFGKHPGYRKKPMELPTTGEDKNQWGEDWNDDSVHNEEPFGQKIGSSAPFDQLVNAVTKDVMSQLKGEAFKAEDKKKANQ